MQAKVSSRGQVIIPKEIRDLLHIRTNDKVDFVVDGKRVLFAPVKPLLNLRGAVPAKGKGDFHEEQARAKTAAASRVNDEIK